MKKKDYENMSDAEFNRLNDELNRKKRSRKGIRNCLIFFAVIVVAFIIFGSGGDDADTSANSTTNTTTSNSSTTNKANTSTTPKTETKKEPETIVYETELTDGNYTCGIDFPAGRYNITAIAGSGNVSSSNMFSGGLNETMAAVADDMYITEFKNAKFENDDVLRVFNGVTIRIYSTAADATPLKKRVQPNTETITLTSGYYISGDDFPAGVYDVIATEGSGNVSSDNMFDGGLNATMGVEKDNFYENEYKNIELPKGIEIKVSGLTIDLVPSK